MSGSATGFPCVSGSSLARETVDPSQFADAHAFVEGDRKDRHEYPVASSFEPDEGFVNSLPIPRHRVRSQGSSSGDPVVLASQSSPGCNFSRTQSQLRILERISHLLECLDRSIVCVDHLSIVSLGQR